MVTDGRILRGMARQGFIEWTPGLERHWTGQTVKRVHVNEGPKLKGMRFIYRGVDYQLRYVDGCFHPFVFRVDASVPSFV